MKASLKARLARGEPVFGSFAFLPSPDIVEIMGIAGFDYVIIDLEHSPKNWETVANMVRAAQLHGMASLIRVRENTEKTILEAIELGIDGIVLPFVQRAADINRAAAAMNYPPRGSRGTCTLTRTAVYGGLRAGFIEHTQRQNDRLVMVAQIEDKIGVENIDEILNCEIGADVIMIGRSDLAASLKRPGLVDDPQVLEATRKVIDACRRHGKPTPTGIGVYAPDESPKWIDAGVRFFFYSADTAMMLNASSHAAQSFTAAVKSHSSRTAAE